MSRTNRSGILVALLAMAFLSSCGVRDMGEDGLGTDENGNSLGGDTSAIAGFWDTRTGLYVLISDVGEWTYIQESRTENCYNFATHSVVRIGTNAETGSDQYTINEDGAVYSFNGNVGDDGILDIQIYGDDARNSVAAYEPIINFLPEDLQYCTTP